MLRIVNNFSFAQNLYFRQNQMFQVSTVYKTKANKVWPVDLGKSDSSKPGGRLDQLEQSKLDNVPCQDPGQYPDWITSKFSNIPKGLCFTKEQIEQLVVGDVGAYG